VSSVVRVQKEASEVSNVEIVQRIMYREFPCLYQIYIQRK
jgi:hypothetical protein